MNKDLTDIAKWADQWLMKFDAQKTALVTFSSKQNKFRYPPLNFRNIVLHESDSHKHLGVTLSQNLSWKKHITSVASRGRKQLGILQTLKYRVPRNTLINLYNSFVRSHLEYASVVWDGCSLSESIQIEQVQYNAGLICTGGMKGSSGTLVREELQWSPLSHRRTFHKLVQFWKIKNNNAPEYLRSILPENTERPYQTRLKIQRMPQHDNIHTNRYLGSFFPSVITEWNKIPIPIREAATVHTFKSHIKKLYCNIPKSCNYNVGFRRANVLHTRFRLKFTQLNLDLFSRNIIHSPLCIVCNMTESYGHYFLDCGRFNNERAIMLVDINQIIDFNNRSKKVKLHTLLFGSNELNHNENSRLFEIVQTFIVQTKRFS